jgi:hypothetical protein
MGSMLFLSYSVYQTAINVFNSIEKARIVGVTWSWQSFSYEWWFYHVKSTFFLGAIAIGVIVFAITYGKRLAGVTDKNSLDFIYFLLLYSLISPLWLITSVYNTIRQRDAAWR